MNTQHLYSPCKFIKSTDLHQKIEVKNRVSRASHRAINANLSLREKITESTIVLKQVTELFTSEEDVAFDSAERHVQCLGNFFILVTGDVH